ncbi:hypothetical protein JKP88DRAFT_272564 [Tribonema minus]|uniref:RING-type domain-containing protein n=1 Tax=Tribonema minus TaxID=303371 RepID=A0A835Z2D7_9STRA|nr:hypothetical protein JKP88DRAFT_272564 [Tribonema minus]
MRERPQLTIEEIDRMMDIHMTLLAHASACTAPELCRDYLRDAHSCECGHTFCGACIVGKTVCPTCGKPVGRLTKNGSLNEMADEAACLGIAAEASIKKGARFSPTSVSELTSWKPPYNYGEQDERHKAMAKEAYICEVIRSAVTAETAPPTPAEGFGMFTDLDAGMKDSWCVRVASLHAAIAYGVWTILVPYYVADRARNGTRAVHWRPLQQDSKIRAERMQAYTTLKAVVAADYVNGAAKDTKLLDYYDWSLDHDDERLRYFQERDFSVEGDSASAGATSTQTIRGVASTFVRTMWAAVIVLGREPHPISAIRPLTAKEWCVLVKGHGVPEDLLPGTRVVPPPNYAELASNDNTFRGCKEFGFLSAITGDAFYSDIFMSRVFFVMRALKVAWENKSEGVDRNDLCGQVFHASSENTTCGFNNNIASVFGALHKSDLAWLDTSGQALTYSVYKFLDTFREDFLCTRRKLRADVAVSRALDRGGLNAKRAAGRLPDTEDDGLREMMRMLVKQIWGPTWRSVIQPWLRKHDLPAEAQAFLLTSASALEEGGIVKFADTKDFTRQDAERVQLLLMLHFSCLRSQVWRDSVVEEYELREGRYSLKMTRAFKTAACGDDGGLPHLAKWDLSETESALVHTVLTLCRPLLATGAKRTSRMFLDAAGAPITQRYIEAKVASVGAEWLGVPRLGPHSLRNMWISWMVNSGLVAEEDFDSLAAYVQVSRCTMLESYVCPSHNGPAQRVGKLLRDGGSNASVTAAVGAAETGAASDTASDDTSPTDTSTTSEDMDVEDGGGTGKPYGKALGAKRKEFKDSIMLAVTAHGGDVKQAFEALATKRRLGQLGAQEQWFRSDVTYFRDTDLPAFKKICSSR